MISYLWGSISEDSLTHKRVEWNTGETATEPHAILNGHLLCRQVKRF